MKEIPIYIVVCLYAQNGRIHELITKCFQDINLAKDYCKIVEDFFLDAQHEDGFYKEFLKCKIKKSTLNVEV